MGAVARPPAQEPPRVLIADDHPVCRDGLAAHLNRSGFAVCAQADDIPGAIQALDATNPDVAVVDVSLKNGNGIELVRRIRDRDRSVRVLVWSMYEDHLYAERAVRAGASGYVNKCEPAETVVAALRHILGGGVFVSPEVTDALLRQAAGAKPGEPAADPIEQLSDRELEVFRLIGMCLSTRQIADRMSISAKTVETYRARVKTKLGAANAAEVVRLAVRWALGAE